MLHETYTLLHAHRIIFMCCSHTVLYYVTYSITLTLIHCIIVYLHTACFCCMVQHTLALFVNKCDISTLLHQQQHNSWNTTLTCIMQWCLIKVISGIRICIPLKQNLHNSNAARQACSMQSSLSMPTWKCKNNNKHV